MRRRQRRGRPGPRLRLGEAFLLLDDNVSVNKEYDNPQCRRFAGNKTACVCFACFVYFPLRVSRLMPDDAVSTATQLPCLMPDVFQR